MKTSTKIELPDHTNGSIDLETLAQLGAIKEYKGLFVVDTGAIYQELYTTDKGRWFTEVKQYKALGYQSIYINGKRYLVHRIIALLFCRGYKSHLVVDHIDLNKLNNHYTNLEWVTNVENIRRAHEYYKANPDKIKKRGPVSSGIDPKLQRRVSDFKRLNPRSEPDYLVHAQKWLDKQVKKYGPACTEYLTKKLFK